MSNIGRVAYLAAEQDEVHECGVVVDCKPCLIVVDGERVESTTCTLEWGTGIRTSHHVEDLVLVNKPEEEV